VAIRLVRVIGRVGGGSVDERVPEENDAARAIPMETALISIEETDRLARGE
jgi:hypothetical protein